MDRFALPRRLSLQELSRSTTFYAFIGFFCFYLYTRIDSLTSNGVSNHLIEYTPAPYDVFWLIPISNARICADEVE